MLGKLGAVSSSEIYRGRILKAIREAISLTATDLIVAENFDARGFHRKRLDRWVEKILRNVSTPTLVLPRPDNLNRRGSILIITAGRLGRRTAEIALEFGHSFDGPISVIDMESEDPDEAQMEFLLRNAHERGLRIERVSREVGLAKWLDQNAHDYSLAVMELTHHGVFGAENRALKSVLRKDNLPVLFSWQDGQQRDRKNPAELSLSCDAADGQIVIQAQVEGAGRRSRGLEVSLLFNQEHLALHQIRPRAGLSEAAVVDPGPEGSGRAFFVLKVLQPFESAITGVLTDGQNEIARSTMTIAIPPPSLAGASPLSLPEVRSLARSISLTGGRTFNLSHGLDDSMVLGVLAGMMEDTGFSYCGRLEQLPKTKDYYLAGIGESPLVVRLVLAPGEKIELRAWADDEQNIVSVLAYLRGRAQKYLQQRHLA